MSTRQEKRLLEACKRGELQTIRELVESKVVDPSSVVDRSGRYHRHQGFTSGWTPLHWACVEGHLKVVQFLVKDGKLDVNIDEGYGRTPLHLACLNGHLEVVKFLLTNTIVTADVNAKDKDRRTPLHWACEKGHLKVVNYLVNNSNSNVNATTNSGSTPLDLARGENHPEVVLCLMTNAKFSDATNNDVLHWACRNGHLEVVKFLLTNTTVTADVNAKDREGWTPLHHACLYGHLEVVKILVNNSNLNVNATDSYGKTPLDLARQRNHPELVLCLIANAKFSDATNNDVLRWACQNGHHKIARCIVLAEDNPNHPHAGLESVITGSECMECRKKFAFYRRKYQCRRCLDEVCNSCSKHKLPISDPTSKPERVCDTCFDILSARHRSSAKMIELSSTDTSVDKTEGAKPSAEAPVSVSDDDEEEESLVKEQLRQDQTDHDSPDVLPLPEVPKEGYICVAQSSLCRVYLPWGINENLSLETLADTNLHPKLASNEIQITPIVRITSDSPSLSLEKPAIIELLKTIQLSDKEANNKVIPLYANSQSLEWKEVGSECNCKVLNDRISLEVTHFSLYAVISRKPCPSSTVKVQPSADIPAPDQSSTPNELTIPELPGFKVQIPPSSVNADREIDITATVLYDSPSVCSEDDRSRLASSCIELEPHGTTFSKEVSISIPILNYAQVKENHPNAQLDIWHSNKRSDSSTKLDWNLVEHSICRDKEGRYVAIVLTQHFSLYKSLWDTCASVTTPIWETCTSWAKYFWSFGVKERCQVFMSQETRIKPSRDITFSIAVVFYPYKEEPEPIPCNYKYMLLDSGLLDLNISNRDAVQFAVDLNEQLSPKKHKSITGSLVISGRQQKSFTVELDGQVEVQGGFPIGELSIGVNEQNHHVLSLIKPVDETSDLASSQAASLPPTATAYQFEESIIAIEDAAEKLGEHATQYKHTPVPMVEATKRIADMWTTMAQLLRKECVLKGRRFKEDIVDLAKSINKESREVVRIATNVAGGCTDSIMTKTVYGVVERIKTISHQLRILAGREATRQRDEASDLEACQLLTTNANNLTSAISEALYHVHSASLRVTSATRMELGLTHMGTDPTTGKLSPYHKVKDDIDGDHYQDSHEGSVGHTQQSFSRTEERDGNRLQSASDYSDLYYKLEQHAAKWRDIGRALGFKEGEMDNIQSRPFLTMLAPNSWLGEMLTQWLQWAPGDGRGSMGFATRDSLRAALLKTNLGQLAQQFE